MVMKLQFLGTGAAEGVPAMYCQCETCKEVRKRGENEFHTRSQYLLDEKIGIDFPPDAYYHSLRFGVDLREIEFLLITHSHMDHFYAHDFILRGYKYASPLQKPLHIFGNAEVCKVFQECTRRELREEVAERIVMREVYPFQPFSFGEGYTAIPLLAQHSKNEQAFVYLIKTGNTSYLHLTDTGRLPEETWVYLKEYFKENTPLDFITFDCTFLFRTAGEVSRHMGLEDNKVTEKRLLEIGGINKKTRFAITHYSHNNAPLSERLKESEERYGYLAAYDGMTVEF